MSHVKDDSVANNNNNNPNNSDYESIQPTESKFWRKIKQDPVVPIGMIGFGAIVLGAILGYNRRDRSKPTSTYWIRTRVYAQGFVVSLLTAAAVYHAIKDKPDPHDIHGHKITQHATESSSNHHHHHQK